MSKDPRDIIIKPVVSEKSGQAQAGDAVALRRRAGAGASEVEAA